MADPATCGTLRAACDSLMMNSLYYYIINIVNSSGWHVVTSAVCLLLQTNTAPERLLMLHGGSESNNMFRSQRVDDPGPTLALRQVLPVSSRVKSQVHCVVES